MVSLEYMIEKQFFNWLSAKESKSQIGKLISVFKKIQDYCVKNRVITKPLAETVNLETIKHIMKVISKTPASEFTQSEKSSAKFVLAYYRSFLSSNEKELKILIKNAEKGKKDLQYNKVDFNINQGLNISNSIPVEFSYFGDKNSGFTTWQGLYCRVVETMWEDYPHIFDELLYNSDDSDKNPIDFKYITYKWQLENPADIGNFFCINVPYKVEEIIERIRFILKMCNVDFDKLEIIYSKKGELSQDNMTTVENIEIVEKKKDFVIKMINTEKVVNKDIDVNRDNKSESGKEENLEMDSVKRDSMKSKGYMKTYTIDLSKSINPSLGVKLDKKRPISFIYRNKEYKDFTTWSELYKKLSNILWDKYGFFITCSLKNSRNSSGLTLENIFDTKGRSAYSLIQKLQSVIDLCSIPHERLILKYIDASEDEIEKIERDGKQEKNEFFEINLGEITTIETLDPVNFRYFGDLYENFNNWKDMYIKVFRVLWDDYRHILDEYIGKAPFEDDLRISFVKAIDKEKLAAPEYIGNNVFIETDYSDGAMLKNVRTVFKLCKVDFENLVIGCKIKKNSGKEDKIEVKESKPVEEKIGEFGKEKKINFSRIPDVGNSVPTRLLYKDIELGSFDNWVELYVSICKELYKNYGFLIAEWVGESFSGNSDMGIDLVAANGLGRLKSPRVITDNIMNNLFVETAYTNRQLVKRIRQVLDICCIEYEDVEIFYKEKKIVPKEEETVEKNPFEIPQGMIRDDNLLLDFTNIPNLIGTTPLAIEFEGRTSENFTNWEELYKEVLKLLWNKYGFFIKPAMSEDFECLTLANVSITEELTPNELADKLRILLNMYSIKYKNFKVYYRGENGHDIPEEYAQREILEVNLSNLGSFEYTIPLKFRYFRKENSSFSNWKGCYVELFKIIWSSHRRALEEYMGKTILRSIDICPVDITDLEHKDMMTAPKCISPDVFVETDYSPYEILKRVRQLIRICNIREDMVTIYYERFSEEEFNEIQKYVQKDENSEDQNKRVTFYMWLINEKKFEEKIAKNYMLAMDEAEEYAKFNEIGNGKIYGNRESDECRNTLEELFLDENFRRFNEENHQKHMAASRQYLDFINKTGYNII